jgi:hypothetical protein
MGARERGPTRYPGNARPPVGDENPSTAARALSRIIERSARVQRPAVRAYLERLRNAQPGVSPADIVAKLEKRYLAAVTASGAAVGSSAALPGIGTLVALSAIAGETMMFLEATTLFVLAVAEVHGIPADHREQRRALVLAVLVGDDSRRAVSDLLGPGRTSGAWLSEGAVSLPLPALSELNSRLLRYFVRRYTLRRGALALGKLLPVGIGAVVGAVGNRMMGKKIIGNARKTFGAPPARWRVTLHLLPGGAAAVRLLDRRPGN